MIELIAVVVILGIVSAFAMPRMVDLRSDAHRSHVAATASAFQTALVMVQMKYRVRGLSGRQDNVLQTGPANQDVDVNANGWPTDTAGANSIGGNATRCVNVWNGILSPAPRISSGTGTTWRAQAAGQRCTYIYTPDSVRRFVYRANNGQVAVTNP